jgi:hypothetical protein
LIFQVAIGINRHERLWPRTTHDRLRPGTLSAMQQEISLNIPKPRLRNKALLVTAFAALALLPAMLFGIPHGGDLSHHYRTAISFADSISKGNLYPGWNAVATSGYGDVSFRFYPPAVYYALGAARALMGNWYDGSLLLFALLSALGGLGAYRWARLYLPDDLAMWAGILYAFMPFHLNELYQAFMLPQYAAGAVLPFVFWFTASVCERQRARDVFGLAATYTLLLFTHLPLAVISSLVMLVYALLLIKRNTWLKMFACLGFAVMLGLVASACYWVTMVAEIQWLKIGHDQPSAWFDYRENFLFWKSVEGSTSWWANVLALATVMLALPGIAALVKKDSQTQTRRLRAVAYLTGFAFFMATPLSYPLWVVLPALKRTQFPWRFLVIVSMGVPLLLAASIPDWIEKARSKQRPLALLVAGCILIPATLIFSQVLRGATYISRETFAQVVETLPASKSLDDWLPVWAGDPRWMTSEVEAGDRAVNVNQWEPQRREFRVAPGSETEARVRTFYYPHWTAQADGKRLPTYAAKDGALMISLPAEAVTVRLEFTEPPRTRIAALVSLAGWLVIGLGLPFCWWRQRLNSRGPCAPSPEG